MTADSSMAVGVARLLRCLLLGGAVILGLLTMHGLNVPEATAPPNGQTVLGSGSPAGPITDAETHAAVHFDGGSAGAIDCGSGAGLTTAMACLLALFLLLGTLGRPRELRDSVATRWRRLLRVSRPEPVRAAAPRLDVLCISRT